MAIYTFGSGTLWGFRTDVSTPQAVRFGTLQSVDMEFSASSKELFGQQQFPVAVARGTAKLTGKAKMGQIEGSVYSNLFFNTSLTTGSTIDVDGEADSVPATSTYTITVTNAGTFVDDLGVRYSATGLPLQRVASVSAAGQYSVVVATGVYTFYSGDASAAVLISYSYTSSTLGQTLAYTNQQLGIQPVFSVVLQTSYAAPGGLKRASLKLYACIADKLAFATKMEDFTIPEFDFACFANDAGKVFDWSFSEVS